MTSAMNVTNKTDNSQGNTMVRDHPDDELPTNRLTGRLQSDVDEIDAVETGGVDWLSKLATTNFTSTGTGTGMENLDEQPPGRWEPSGMAEHTAAPKMVPTLGARLSRGLRKSFIISTVLVISVSVLAGAAYGLAATDWFGGVLGARPSVPASQSSQAAQQAPVQTNKSSLPDVAQGGALPVIEAPLSGSAKELRDRGIAEYKTGNSDEAIRLLQGSININSDDAITYYQLGLAYLLASKREYALEDAEMAFRSAISLQPGWAAPQQGLAESLLRRGFYKEAIAPALEATRLDPTLGEAWMTLGRAYQSSGQEADATRAFAEAARQSPPPLVMP